MNDIVVSGTGTILYRIRTGISIRTCHLQKPNLTRFIEFVRKVEVITEIVMSRNSFYGFVLKKTLKLSI